MEPRKKSIVLPLSQEQAIIKEGSGLHDRLLRRGEVNWTLNIPDYVSSLTESIDGKEVVDKERIFALKCIDYNALQIEIHRVCYEDVLVFWNICSFCGEPSPHAMDLSKLNMIPMPSGSSGGKNPLFDYKLPRSERRIKMQYLTVAQQRIIDSERMNTGNTDLNQSDFMSLHSLEGCDPVTYEEVLNLPLLDHKFIRDKQKELVCGYDTNILTQCSNKKCMKREIVDIMTLKDFLFPGG